MDQNFLSMYFQQQCFMGRLSACYTSLHLCIFFYCCLISFPCELRWYKSIGKSLHE